MTVPHKYWLSCGAGGEGCPWLEHRQQTLTSSYHHLGLPVKAWQHKHKGLKSTLNINKHWLANYQHLGLLVKAGNTTTEDSKQSGASTLTGNRQHLGLLVKAWQHNHKGFKSTLSINTDRQPSAPRPPGQSLLTQTQETWINLEHSPSNS